MSCHDERGYKQCLEDILAAEAGLQLLYNKKWDLYAELKGFKEKPVIAGRSQEFMELQVLIKEKQEQVLARLDGQLQRLEEEGKQLEAQAARQPEVAAELRSVQEKIAALQIRYLNFSEPLKVKEKVKALFFEMKAALESGADFSGLHCERLKLEITGLTECLRLMEQFGRMDEEERRVQGERYKGLLDEIIDNLAEEYAVAGAADRELIKEEYKFLLEYKVNYLAKNFVFIADPVERERQQRKLSEVLMRFLLQPEPNPDDEALKRCLADYALQEEWHRSASFDPVIFMECTLSCLLRFMPYRGEYINYYRSSYSLKKRGSSGNRLFDQLNRCLKQYAAGGAVGFSGKELYELSREQLKELLQACDMDTALLEKYYAVILEVQVARQPVWLDSQESDLLEARLAAPATADPQLMLEAKAMVCAFYEGVVGAAKEAQLKYFKCFVLADLLNEGSFELLQQELAPCYEADFYRYLEQEGLLGGKIRDKDVAAYQGVRAGTVSKRRAEYEAQQAVMRARLQEEM